MSKTYVIAGTKTEAQFWINKNYQERVAIGDQQVSTSDYVYVSRAEDLLGIANPHGVFVGNWLGRPDIFEIVQRLMMNSIHPNAALEKIYKDLTPKVRPTPKKTYQANINEASELLAKAIDNHVLDTLIKKINGGLINP